MRNNNIVVMIEFNTDGFLPPGIHNFEWEDFKIFFGTNGQRKNLITGLELLIRDLRRGNCSLIYVDGSFVTSKEFPNDYDLCWDVKNVNGNINPLLLDFSKHGRILQKAYYKGDIFPANTTENQSGKAFLDFFQIDKSTGNPKGIVAIKI